jgi:hypothetical protein
MHRLVGKPLQKRIDGQIADSEKHGEEYQEFDQRFKHSFSLSMIGPLCATVYIWAA